MSDWWHVYRGVTEDGTVVNRVVGPSAQGPDDKDVTGGTARTKAWVEEYQPHRHVDMAYVSSLSHEPTEDDLAA